MMLQAIKKSSASSSSSRTVVQQHLRHRHHPAESSLLTAFVGRSGSLCCSKSTTAMMGGGQQQRLFHEDNNEMQRHYQRKIRKDSLLLRQLEWQSKRRDANLVGSTTLPSVSSSASSSQFGMTRVLPTLNTASSSHHQQQEQSTLLPPPVLALASLNNYSSYPMKLTMIRSLSTTTTTAAAKSKSDEITTSPIATLSSSTTGASSSPSSSTSQSFKSNNTTPSEKKKEAPPSSTSTSTSNTASFSTTSSSSTSITAASILKKSSVAISSFTKYLFSLLRRTPSTLYYYLTHPTEFQNKLREFKEIAIKEAHHYYMGSKLLWADVRTAKQLLGRTLRGSTLSRRERKQLLRTVTDVFRLVPMSIFVLVPFMELALPIALKFFPNMLPSTFQDSLKEEEKMKGELQMRISMAGFFQDTLAELAKEQKKFAQQLRKTDSSPTTTDASSSSSDSNDTTQQLSEKEASATSFLSFLKKARTGQAIPPEVIIKFAKYFEDNLTLDNMGRMQLINMCKYMGIPPYGNDNLLRFQLRHRIRLLKDDDQRILWEGIDSLTKMELREACRERGMRSTGLSKAAYRMALQQWLELSVQKDVPISLLIMSRTFFLHDEMLVSGSGGEEGVAGVGVGGTSVPSTNDGVIGLADAMSGIDKEVLNEIVLEMASSEEKSSNADVIKIQLEVLEHQNELIKEEQEERDAAVAKKLKEEKEKISAGIASVATGEKDVLRDGGVTEGGMLKEMDTTTITGLGVQASADATAVTTDVASTIPKESVSLSGSRGRVVDEDVELSTEEIDAISQLTSPDPVLREREELKRIKCKMQGESAGVVVDSSEEVDTSMEGGLSGIPPAREPILVDETQGVDKESKDILMLAQADATTIEAAAKEGLLCATTPTTASHDEEQPPLLVGDRKLQKAIDRLKSRVESMVGKIESRLSDIEVKIGNKFHLLDKDGDGVLTMEEMAQVLQTVLKRELTAEEAMAIASDMDQNKDGVFSIAELAQWAETNTIVKLAEDGREKDLDDMITERVANLNERNKLEQQQQQQQK
ncbi:hypothetical protein ACHAXH_007278 [Discostella pseudostelligera]